MNRLVLASILMTASCFKSPDPPPVAPVPEEGFERLGPPKPGEWLHHFREDGQTYEGYVARCANRKTAARGVLYVQPLGDVLDRHGQTVELMREYASAFLGLEARVAPAVPMFENGYVPQRRQYNATMIIGQLAERAPADALVYVGITDRDLFSKGLHFVFGEGSLSGRAGVYSLHRYATPDRALFLRRALKLMVHEVGHILSIEHCVFYRCVMQGANSLQEDDGHPMHLCPADLRKLEWNTGAAREARYRRLLEFYRRAGLAAEASWVERRLNR